MEVNAYQIALQNCIPLGLDNSGIMKTYLCSIICYYSTIQGTLYFLSSNSQKFEVYLHTTCLPTTPLHLLLEVWDN